MFADPFKSALIYAQLLSLYNPRCTLLPEKEYLTVLFSLYTGMTSLFKKGALYVKVQALNLLRKSIPLHVQGF